MSKQDKNSKLLTIIICVSFVSLVFVLITYITATLNYSQFKVSKSIRQLVNHSSIKDTLVT